MQGWIEPLSLHRAISVEKPVSNIDHSAVDKQAFLNPPWEGLKRSWNEIEPSLEQLGGVRDRDRRAEEGKDQYRIGDGVAGVTSTTGHVLDASGAIGVGRDGFVDSGLIPVKTGGSEASQLDTLAQLDQNHTSVIPSLSPEEYQSRFQKRGRAKFLSRALALGLAGLRSPLEKSYRNTVYCSECVVQENGVMTAKFCGNRWCMTCSRIRTARAINAYLPVLETWVGVHLVTLTVPNCAGGQVLRDTITRMLDVFTRCKRSIKRTGCMDFRGVRKLEVTYNVRRKDYHPHLHVIVEGREQGEELRRLWLHHFRGVADAKAQDVRACDMGGIAEIFKYFTKLLTKVGKGKRGVAPLMALDTIFQAMKGRRVWQPVGFTLPKEIEQEIEGEEMVVSGTPAFKRQAERVYWEWVQDVADWVDRETGEALSEYEPSRAFVELVSSIGVSVEVIDDS